LFKVICLSSIQDMPYHTKYGVLKMPFRTKDLKRWFELTFHSLVCSWFTNLINEDKIFNRHQIVTFNEGIVNQRHMQKIWEMIPPRRKLENVNNSWLIVPLCDFYPLKTQKQQAAVLGHHEVRDTRHGNTRESRHSRSSRASPHRKFRLHFDYSLVKGAKLNKIYHHYKRNDQLKVAIGNYRKRLTICFPR